MTALIVTSIGHNSGKTMLAAGLGRYWLNSGKKVGYFKPLFDKNTAEKVASDKDLAFIRRIFALTEANEVLSPFVGTQGEAVKQTYETISAGKDIIIIEGGTLNESKIIISDFSAQILILHDYSTPLSGTLAESQKLGSSLLGLVINKVPRHQMKSVQDQAAGETTKAGIRLLGLIPEDRILMTLSVADLAESLQGKILNSPDKGDELIENFMMGSSTFDRGAAYYNRKNNKAVLLWGERPGYRKAAIANLQSAALQTSVRCIVISNNGEPIPAVSQKAAEKQVPIISAPGTLLVLLTTLENAMGNLKFVQEKKLPRLEEVLRQSLNLNLISEEVS